jgi:hypothetical protein
MLLRHDSIALWRSGADSTPSNMCYMPKVDQQHQTTEVALQLAVMLPNMFSAMPAGAFSTQHGSLRVSLFVYITAKQYKCFVAASLMAKYQVPTVARSP